MAVSLLLLLSVASMTAGNRLRPFQVAGRRMKVFACEGSSLFLSCPAGTSLHFVRANFGRFSMSVCPSTSPSPAWSTRCLQPTTLRQLTAQCGGQAKCDLKVDSLTFGDPCPDTHKYLQLLYSCEREEKEEVSSMVPPWLLSMEEMIPAFPSSSEPTTTTTTTSAPPTTDLRNRFFSYMEKMKRDRLQEEEKTQRRVNTLIELEEEEELMIEKELEAVPFLGEEELAQQKEILMIVTISLMVVTILLCVGLALGRHFSPKKLPPTIYYEGSAYLDIQPPSPQYIPFLRNPSLPASLPASVPTSMSNALTLEQSCNQFGSQEYDYIDFPVKLTHI